MDKDFYTIYEVAKILQLHHNTVRTMIRNNELPAVQIRRQWRIKKTDLEAYTDTSKDKIFPAVPETPLHDFLIDMVKNL